MHNNKGKKKEDTGIEVCTIYLCWGDSLKRPKKGLPDCKKGIKKSKEIIVEDRQRKWNTAKKESRRQAKKERVGEREIRG